MSKMHVYAVNTAIGRIAALARSGPRVFTWKGVLHRDLCAYCGAPGETIDHIVARSRGGGEEHRVDNSTAACRACNRGKGSQSLFTFLVRGGMRPGYVPPPTAEQLRAAKRRERRKVRRERKLAQRSRGKMAISLAEAAGWGRQ